MTDINAILNYRRPKNSYYDILGCSQSSDINQINKEYKIRALQLHPDKNCDPQSLEEFRTLQSAKEVLTNESTRKLYDAWLNSGINVPFEQFQSKKSHAFHWATSNANKKLSIQDCASKGQGSDMKTNDDSKRTTQVQGSLLEKFRNYEVVSQTKPSLKCAIDQSEAWIRARDCGIFMCQESKKMRLVPVSVIKFCR